MYHETYQLTSVTLNVLDLPTMSAFYQKQLGMSVLEESYDRLGLGIAGAKEAILYLQQVAAPEVDIPRYGLYHVAYLLPSRTALGNFLVHAIQNQLPLIGASDHGYSEAIYLEDPEGNGIEIYRDKPLDQWDIRPDGRIEGVTLEMDGQGVYESAQPQAGPYQLPQGTRIGHMHLSVRHSQPAAIWWNQLLGMQTKSAMSSGAWLSSGDYHHQIAVNQWAGSRLAKQEVDSPGLAFFTIRAQTPVELAAIRDRAENLGAVMTPVTDGWDLVDANGIRLRILSQTVADR